jgi:phenylacetate-CoA ligase
MDRQKLYYRAPLWLQNLLVSAYGSYQKRKRYGTEHALTRELITAARRWSSSEVAQYQGDRVRQMVEHCSANVPYYRDLLASARLLPRDIRSVADLAKLPVLEKERVRIEHERLVADGATSYWKQYTSGSTGTPLAVHLNQQTYQLFATLLVDHEAHHGVTVNDLRATFAGRMVQPLEDERPPFWRYNRAEHQAIFSAYHLSDRTIPLYLAELERIQPKEIIGYPSAIYTVADYCVRHGVRPNIRPRIVITNSETLWAWQRAAIESVFGCRVADYYGSAECVSFAGQCEAGAYHFNPLLSVVEILDQDGRQVRPGETGTLVCTTLTNEVMPLIRYKVGDEAIRLKDACPCGNEWPSAQAIVGREDDSIVTGDGRSIGRIDHIFKGLIGIRECQVIQERIDQMYLDVVADKGFDESQRQLLVKHVRERIGDGVELQIREVAEIPRTRRGKFRGVISKVNRPAASSQDAGRA